MTAKNRAGLIGKLHTALKKHYKPAPAAPGRPLLEHILYAALLEDAPVDLADEGFAKCEQEFFDWNEVRVTSVTELAEVLVRFPSPPATSARLKRCLQSVFEGFYNFDIDHLKKENLGKAVAKFEAMSGISPFVLAYLVQHGLGGHAIPVNAAGMHIMLKAGIVSEAEARAGKVPGLERAIAKSKAIEFSSMLHQAAVALQVDPLDKTVWEVIRSVNKDAEVSPPKKQGPKRVVAKAEADASAAGVTNDKSASRADSKAKPKSKAKSKAGDPKTADDVKQAATSSANKATAKPIKAKPSAGKTRADQSAATEAKVDEAASKAGSLTKSAAKAPSSGSSASKASANTAAAKPGAAAAKSSPAKKDSKSAKKSAASKTTSSAKPPAGKSASKPTGAAPSSADDSAAGESANGEDTTSVSGNANQILTKQKPR